MIRVASRAVIGLARGLGVVVFVCLGSAAGATAHADELSGLPVTIERIKPSIVAVGTVLPTRSPAYLFRGTGFVVGDGTLIATNNHVVPASVDVANQEVLTIALPKSGVDAALRTATLVARDPEHDLALLRISGPPLTSVRIGDATRVREGETYAFIGFPLGSAIGLFPTTHHALVSALTPITLPQPNARTLDPALVKRLRSDRFVIFQLDATAYPGNSGSPMFDVETGEVVAVINMVFVKGGRETALSTPSGISYAIPSTYLRRLLDSLKSGAQ